MSPDYTLITMSPDYKSGLVYSVGWLVGMDFYIDIFEGKNINIKNQGKIRGHET
jgi:hypothetical protein